MRKAALGAIVAVLALSAASAHASDPPPQVTVIGDSVLTAVYWNKEPLALLEKGMRMNLDIGVCRRLEGESCPFEGGRVPTLVDAVKAMGTQIATTVLVEVGYNDDEATFPQDIEDSLATLHAAGVKQVLWANLHGFGPHWDAMNADLAAAAKRHPELTVIDWNGYASDHWSWFQGDNIHLTHDGAMAIAGLLNTALREALAPPLAVATTTLPVARVGKPYLAHLAARGGIAPYTWRVVGGRLPRGLSLRPKGRIDGVPRRTGRIRIVVSAQDSLGRAAAHAELLKVAVEG